MSYESPSTPSATLVGCVLMRNVVQTFAVIGTGVPVDVITTSLSASDLLVLQSAQTAV